MDFDLFSCTLENLNGLKFNELQKLSSQYRVNKRWAKKREIIDSLLSLRDQEMEKRNAKGDNEDKNVDSQNVQWMDAEKVFSSVAVDKFQSDDEIDRRLTFNVIRSTEDVVDKRLTFNVVKNRENQFTRDVSLEMCNNIDRRLTYNADELKKMQRSAKNATESVQVIAPVQENSNHGAKTETLKEEVEVDEKSTVNNQEIHVDTKRNEKVLGKSFNEAGKSTGLKSTRTKMLTIPYSRVPTQRKQVAKEMKTLGSSKLKLSEKITAACKLTKPRVDTSKPSQMPQKPDNSIVGNKSTGMANSINANNLSTLKPNIYNHSMKSLINELSGVDTTRRIVPRRKSKTEDNVLVTNLKASRNLKFYSPNESDTKNHKRLSQPHCLQTEMNLRSKIPKVKPLVETQKPLTAKKMPDFSKIHQRQFEQMDSLLDYKRKKEERAKKLFGIPQPGIPVKVNKGNVPSTVFQFKSTQNEKENTATCIKKPTQTNLKRKPSRQDLMNLAGSKSNIVTNVKEQNRKHLNGVRMNKRFELQMKCRKL